MRVSRVIVLTLLTLLLCGAASATMVLPSSIEKMTLGSDLVVRGRIASQSVRAEGATIVTDVVVELAESLKPQANPATGSITVKVLGGTVGDTTMKLDLAPAFADGEEVALFLKRNGDRYLIYGLYYGACRIRTDGLTTTVTGPLYQTGQVYDFTTGRMTVNPVPFGGEPWQNFKARVLAVISAGAE